MVRGVQSMNPPHLCGHSPQAVAAATHLQSQGYRTHRSHITHTTFRKGTGPHNKKHRTTNYLAEVVCEAVVVVDDDDGLLLRGRAAVQVGHRCRRGRPRGGDQRKRRSVSLNRQASARETCGWYADTSGPSTVRRTKPGRGGGEKVEEAIRTRRRPEAREGGSGRMRRGTSRRCGGGGDPRGGDVGAGHLGGAGREGARVGGGVTCL